MVLLIFVGILNYLQSSVSQPVNGTVYIVRALAAYE